MVRLLPLLFVTELAAASCPGPISSSGWDGRVADAEGLYVAFEFEQFQVAVQELALDLPCVSEPLAPSQAARYHRILGIDHFTRRRPEAAAESFLAARRAEPDYVLSTELIPEAHEIRDLYTAQDPTAVTVEAIPAASEGAVYFDGRASLDRARSAPTIFQYVDERGDAESTAYLLPSAITPDYPRIQVTLPSPSGDTVAVGAGTSTDPGAQAIRPPKKKPTLLILGGSLLAAGTGSAVGAIVSKQDVQDATTVEQADQAWTREQIFGYSAYGLWGLGAASVGAHFIW